MTRYLSLLVACVASVCGLRRGAENPTMPETGRTQRSTPPQPAAAGQFAVGEPPGRGRRRIAQASPIAAVQAPATLAQRLRAVKDPVWLVAWFEDGIVSGLLEDREITLGRRVVKLSQLRRVRGWPATDVEMSDGTRLSGHFDELPRIVVTIGNGSHSLDLTRTAEAMFVTPYNNTGTTLDATLRGEFPCPLPSSQPVTSAHIFVFPPKEVAGKLFLEADTKSSLFVAARR